jgi:DnaJ-domain-containing protein 1
MKQSMDKDWLVDKLAELEKLKVEMQKEIEERRDQWGKLKDEADSSRLVIEDLG